MYFRGTRSQVLPPCRLERRFNLRLKSLIHDGMNISAFLLCAGSKSLLLVMNAVSVGETLPCRRDAHGKRAFVARSPSAKSSSNPPNSSIKSRRNAMLAAALFIILSSLLRRNRAGARSFGIAIGLGPSESKQE
jgi:hypothetical protein